MVFICRLCGKAENESSGIGIFSEEGVKQSLAYKIKISLDISVYEYDPLPKSACTLCIGKVFNTCAFQECCRRTQIILRDQYLMSKSFPGRDGLAINNGGCNISIQNKTSNWINESSPTVNPGFLLPQPLEGNESTSVLMPSVISTETLQKSTFDSVQSETQLTLRGEPFEFDTFIRSGVLDDLVMAVKGTNTPNQNSKNARKPRNTNTNSRKKKQNSQTTVDQSSLLNSEKGPLSVTAKPSTSGQSSRQQAAQVSNISCSLEVTNHEPSIVGTISNMPVTTASANVVNNCVYMQTPSAMPIFTQLQASGTQDENCDSIKILNVYSVQGEQNTSSSVPMPLATLPTNTVTTVTNTNPTSFSVIPGTAGMIPVVNMPNSSITTPGYMPQSPANESLPMSFLVAQSTPSTVSWHSPTPGNPSATPENIQNSINTTSENRKWHTPSKSPTQTSTPKEINKRKNTTTPENIQNSINTTSSENRKWHTPPKSPTQTSTPKEINKSKNNSRKSNKQPSSGKNTKKPSEEEDDIQIVEVVKANKGSLAQHWEKCESGYKCKECKKTYKKLVKCENHIRTHLGIKPFECSICNRRFAKRRFLNEHHFNHTGEKLYECKECPKSFRYRKNLKVHLETHTEVVSRSYLCEICRKTFKSQYDYWNHKTSKHML